MDNYTSFQRFQTISKQEATMRDEDNRFAYSAIHRSKGFMWDWRNCPQNDTNAQNLGVDPSTIAMLERRGLLTTF